MKGVYLGLVLAASACGLVAACGGDDAQRRYSASRPGGGSSTELSTIIRCRPIIAFENGLRWSAQRFGYEPDAIPRFFERLDYTIVDFYGNPITPDHFEFRGQTFMFFAGPYRDFRFLETRAILEEFWHWADALDCSSWDRTVNEVIARAEGVNGAA